MPQNIPTYAEHNNAQQRLDDHTERLHTLLELLRETSASLTRAHNKLAQLDSRLANIRIDHGRRLESVEDFVEAAAGEALENDEPPAERPVPLYLTPAELDYLATWARRQLETIALYPRADDTDETLCRHITDQHQAHAEGDKS